LWLYKSGQPGVYRVDESECRIGARASNESHAPQILLYGRALGLGHSEAEDVLQETFLALMQKDEEPEEPRHYCLRSFRNKALNFPPRPLAAADPRAGSPLLV